MLHKATTRSFSGWFFAFFLWFPPCADLIDPYLQKLFETGVDEMSWDDMDELQDCNFPWPDVAEAQAFRLKVLVGFIHGPLA